MGGWLSTCQGITMCSCEQMLATLHLREAVGHFLSSNELADLCYRGATASTTPPRSTPISICLNCLPRRSQQTALRVAVPDTEHQNAPGGLRYNDGSDPRCRKLPSGPCGLALWRSILHALHLGTILHQRPLYTLTDAVGFLPAVVNSDRHPA